MKLLLLLIAGSVFSNLSFSQQLKPEIKELMGKTEINPPSGLINAENNRKQRLYPSASMSRGVRDTFPDRSKILKNWQNFDSKYRVFPNSPIIALQKNENPRAPGVYRLPLDNMPCIVPDTKRLAPIPNLFNGTIGVPYRSKIPNPGIPKILRNTK